MGAPEPKGPLDPNFPDYVYTCVPLAKAYLTRKGGKAAASLFMGDWLHVQDDVKQLPAKGRVHVKYRGGEGYVSRTDFSWERKLEVFFIDVDTGDAVLIQTPDDRRVLIDGGQTDDAYQFIVNKYRLDKPDNFVDFEAIVATHCDQDHTKGLIKILKHPKIAVKRVYHNGLFKRKDDTLGSPPSARVSDLLDAPTLTETPPLSPLMTRFVEAVRQAKKNLPVVQAKMRKLPRWKGRVGKPEGGFQFRRLDARADKFLPPYDGANKYLTVEVLWPRAHKAGAAHWLPGYKKDGSFDEGKTVNGNSIVLMLRHGKHRILLTGDLNAPAMNDLVAAYPGDGLLADVYKAAHHGSQDFTIGFVEAVKANAAVISSGDDRNDQHGHPRAVLVGSLTRHSRCERPAVFCTELAACFRKLSQKEQKAFKRGGLYERSIQGIVHLRSDGERLCLGTVHGRAQSKTDPQANLLWKWDVWPE